VNMDNLRDKLLRLQDNQLDYVIARSKTTSVRKACDDIGISTSTLYGWDNREELEVLANELKVDRYIEVEMKFRNALPDAVDIIIAGMSKEEDGQRYSTRFRSACEVLDRGIGKPTQRVDQQTDGKMEIVVTYEDRRNDTETA
jgi:GDP-D-mannose dehydratase